MYATKVMNRQIKKLRREVDQLQKKYGSPDHRAIYGAGCLSKPKLLFLFMNPTASNISAANTWSGLRAPWLGTKNIWRLFYRINFIGRQTFDQTQLGKNSWDKKFAKRIYQELSDNSVYITNLAKCTQLDARPLKDKVFKTYLDNTLTEIYLVNPINIVTLGSQVSSILLNKKIAVSNNSTETLIIKKRSYQVYPTYYPVGQGMRNLDKAINRIKKIIK